MSSPRASEAAAEAYRQTLVVDVFARPVHDYVYQCLGRPVCVLQAGGAASADELGLSKLRDAGFEIHVVTVDQDHPRQARQTHRRPDKTGRPGAMPDSEITVGDLRTIPLPPRSFDIVHCSLLLDRINHVALVLDRFGAALRPGGLLLLRIKDRDCAAGFLDRILPGWLRGFLWRRLYPGQPGPFRAVYEPTASARGVAAYLPMRGLVIAHRKNLRTLPAEPARLSAAVAAARKFVALFSRGRLTDAHDQVLFVIRKPEDRFARVVLMQSPRGRNVAEICAEAYRP